MGIRRLTLALLLGTSLILAGCSGASSSNPATAQDESSLALDSTLPAASAEAASPPEATPAPSPAPLPRFTPTPERAPAPLTQDALRKALLTPDDLGPGWTVKTRKLKPASPEDFDGLSPECVDLSKELRGSPVSKSTQDAGYVELTEGENFDNRIVSMRIDPMPEEGFEAFAENWQALVYECPSISTDGDGSTVPASGVLTYEEIRGYEGNSAALLMSVNAFFINVYIFTGWIPVGDNLVTVTSTWTQQSRKAFSEVVGLAVNKVKAAQAASGS